MKTSYGWMSAKQAKECGTAFYSTPFGDPIEVSFVTDGRQHETAWDDMVFLGEVTTFLKRGQGGELDDLIDYLAADACSAEENQLDAAGLARLQAFVDKRLHEAAIQAQVARLEQHCNLMAMHPNKVWS